MVRVQKTKSGQFFITIPLNVVETMGIEKGDILQFYIELKKGIVELRKSD